ncbi:MULTISPECIES: hypothetical protein [Methylobacteriaceae]|uniref:hypothetical protein n=1 Tax=Methylobacteriaceae TaxID=119045 RepID=UPI001174BA64|nr:MULTISPECIES: hypothetical protein [Methylobacteriaceae]GEL42923.1 hypothetical protein MEX01_35140 [Methylorubrum extorquens]
MRTASNIHFSKPVTPLDASAREQLVDALHAAGSPTVSYVRVIDADWQPIAPELDLVVQTSSTRAAREVWAAWALEQDLDGRYRVEVLATNPLAPGRKRRPREMGYAADVDLDLIVLEAELAELDAADRALGL